MKRVLFACVENSNRSQMAEAFARMYGAGVIDPVSAGSRPSGLINPRAVQAMREVGYDLSAHTSKSLADVTGPFVYVFTMGCGEECPFVAASRRDDWSLPDPKDLPPEEFNVVRDEIERRVRELIAEIRTAGP
ncbi:MAG: arsenate reductase ArsC [Gemmatimonadales bacterium]|nr:MAG: arsenate reductase ArsC [Gemmatimonadales bacterium]